MGLRIREALGVERPTSGPARTAAIICGCGARPAGIDARVPLKHRKEGEGRNVPVPDFVWDMVHAMPDA